MLEQALSSPAPATSRLVLPPLPLQAQPHKIAALAEPEGEELTDPDAGLKPPPKGKLLLNEAIRYARPDSVERRLWQNDPTVRAKEAGRRLEFLNRDKSRGWTEYNRVIIAWLQDRLLELVKAGK